MNRLLIVWLLGIIGLAVTGITFGACGGSEDGGTSTNAKNGLGMTDVVAGDYVGNGWGYNGDEDPADPGPWYESDAMVACDIPYYGEVWAAEDSSGAYGDSAYNGSQPNVKAGVYDDNEVFEAFLDYLEKYQNLPGTLPIDVAERYVVTVMADEDQRPLPGARVTISAHDEEVFVATTNAAGQFLFHPRAHGVGDSVIVFQYTVAVAGQDVASGTFDRDIDGAEVTLDTGTGYAVPGVIQMDVALVLDTTGSMGDEIQKLKDTYKLVAQEIQAIVPNLDVRYGMVLYRDKGDAYVTQLVPFTGDVQNFLNALNQVGANGGGDTPEDLQAALNQGINGLQWRPEADIRVLFTLADAEPHLYGEETPYPLLLAQAVAEGIHLHAIAASGSSEAAEYVFRQMAQFCFGKFLFLTYSNDVPGKPGSGTGSGGEDGYTVHQYLSGTLDELMVKLVTLDVYALLNETVPEIAENQDTEE